MSFAEQSHTVTLDTPQITGIDFSDDGALLAVSCFSSEPFAPTPCIHLYRTSDAHLLGTYGIGSGRSVVFAEDSTQLYVLLQTPDGTAQLQRIDVGDGSTSTLATYGGQEGVRRLVRCQASTFIAVLGTAIEIWNTRPMQVVRFKESECAPKPLRACFNRSGSHVYLYGLTQGEIARLDVATASVNATWEAPKPHGKQVVVSPDERFLSASGEHGTGMFVYDLANNARHDTFMFDESSYADEVMFTADGAGMLTRTSTFEILPMDGGDPIVGPPLVAGPASAMASAWTAPVVAFGIQSHLCWVRYA